MKFLNNTIGQITPFLFYLFGGYLVIQGELTLGALVAALAAYKDLISPWKELLNHYQNHEDVKIKYQQILEQYSPEDLLAETGNSDFGQRVTLKDSLTLEGVSWGADTDGSRLSDIHLEVDPGRWIAIIGQNAVQRSRLAHLLVGIESPQAGSIKIGAQPIEKFDTYSLCTQLAYAGPDPHFFFGTIQENIIYGLNLQPDHTAGSLNGNQFFEDESFASGNSSDVFETSWLDRSFLQIDQGNTFEDHYLAAAASVGSEKLMYQTGLQTCLNAGEFPELSNKLMGARSRIRETLSDCGLEKYVPEFSLDVIDRNATVAENILFGIPVSEVLDLANLSSNRYLHEVLGKVGLLDDVVSIVKSAVNKVGHRLNQYPNNPEIINQLGLSGREELAKLGKRIKKSDWGDLNHEDRSELIGVFLHIVLDTHKLGQSTELLSKLLHARSEFAINLPDEFRGKISKFDKDIWHPYLTIRDNLLFGRLVPNEPAAEKKILKIVDEVIQSMDLQRDIMLQQSQSHVGINGKKLTTANRHTIALARLLIKQPKIIVFHDALAPLETTVKQKIRENIKTLLPATTVIWIDRGLEDKLEFEQVYRLTNDGVLTDISEPKSTLDENDESNLEIIGRSAIFGLLDAGQQQLLADNSGQIRLSEGEFAYNRGDTTRYSYIVIEGQMHGLRDETNRDSIASVLKVGDTFSAIEILSQRDQILTVIATKETRLLRIDGDVIRDIIETNIQDMQTLLRALTEQWAIASRGKSVY